MATLWPLSAAAAVLAIVDCAPELRRPWRKRRRSNAFASFKILHAFWSLSSGLALTSTSAVEASALVVANFAVSCVVCGAVAAANAISQRARALQRKRSEPTSLRRLRRLVNRKRRDAGNQRLARLVEAARLGRCLE